VDRYAKSHNLVIRVRTTTMYMDRIFEPSKYNKYANSKTPKKAVVMKCDNCGELLGTPYLYEKEKREAYRMFQSSVIKKKL